MRPGVYYWPKADKIICLWNVKTYRDLKRTFVIATVETRKGFYPKTLIKGRQRKLFKYIGAL